MTRIQKANDPKAVEVWIRESSMASVRARDFAALIALKEASSGRMNLITCLLETYPYFSKANDELFWENIFDQLVSNPLTFEAFIPVVLTNRTAQGSIFFSHLQKALKKYYGKAQPLVILHLLNILNNYDSDKITSLILHFLQTLKTISNDFRAFREFTPGKIQHCFDILLKSGDWKNAEQLLNSCSTVLLNISELRRKLQDAKANFDEKLELEQFEIQAHYNFGLITREKEDPEDPFTIDYNESEGDYKECESP